MKKHNKLKLAVIISIVSVIITILSLSFSIYTGIKNVSYQDDIKNIQTNTQILQQGNIQFQESYQKISLAENSLTDIMNNCNEVNKIELNRNLKLLNDARTALIENDYATVTNSLNNIDQGKICITQVPISNPIYLEIGIFVLIWIALIITLIKVSWKKFR